jgi:hypothetical protein
MPCPFFDPRYKLNDDAWDPPARMPLRAAWGGTCRVAPDFQPAESQLREVCNVGYARGRCGHFPNGELIDAVRFSAGSHGRTIFVLEKDCAPVRHGELAELPMELQALARAFLEG